MRGKLQPPLGYDLRVWGRFANHDEELGVPLIMRELEAEGLRGTFFVEPLGARFFGVDQLAAVCRAMRARGHDVQLHAHPMQSAPLAPAGGRASWAASRSPAPRASRRSISSPRARRS